MVARNQKPLAQKAFLAAFADCGVVTHAATAAGIYPRRHYEWLDRDPEYVEKFEVAYLAACDSLEQEARRRAIEGVKEPVYQGGELAGYKTKYSDTLLIFLLKGALPDKYADRKQISGGNGGPLEIVEEIIFSNDQIDRAPTVDAITHEPSESADDSGLF